MLYQHLSDERWNRLILILVGNPGDFYTDAYKHVTIIIKYLHTETHTHIYIVHFNFVTLKLYNYHYYYYQYYYLDKKNIYKDMMSLVATITVKRT